MENLPFISCKCITYGRLHFLEEAVESFLKQDYAGKKELIIVNDYPLQKLSYDHPEIKIINLEQTFLTIGEKENFALHQCSGELIAVWDDDDIAMPNHLSNIAKYFTEDGEILFWGNGVLFHGDNIHELTGLGNSGIVYTKKIWEELGGHPLENAGYDTTFVNQIIYREGAKPMIVACPPDEEISWFYMWGGRGYHMSGEGTDHPGKLNAIQRHSAHVESERKAGNIPTGDIIIKPNWRLPYSDLLKKRINANK
jgi:glycosyltransferase involved in cell wall biosynthesis